MRLVTCFTAFLEVLRNQPRLHNEAFNKAFEFVNANGGKVTEKDGITCLMLDGDAVIYSKPSGHFERFCYQFLRDGHEVTEIIIEIDDVYEQQFLEKPRKRQWSHISEWDASRVTNLQSDVSKDRPFSLEEIKNELKDAHNQHGKSLRVVRTTRVTISESTVVDVFKK